MQCNKIYNCHIDMGGESVQVLYCLNCLNISVAISIIILFSFDSAISLINYRPSSGISNNNAKEDFMPAWKKKLRIFVYDHPFISLVYFICLCFIPVLNIYLFKIMLSVIFDSIKK